MSKTKALFVALLALVFCLRAPAAFAAACATGPTNYHDGFDYTAGASGYGGVHYEGTSAIVTVRDSTLCTGISTTNNFSDAWTMIANSGGDGWAQIGYEHDPGLANRTFTQAAQSFTNTHPVIYYASVTTGTSIQYWEQFDAACFCIHMNKGTTRVADTYFNPVAAGVWSSNPWEPQFSAETGYKEDPVGGSPGSPIIIDSLQFQDYFSDNFGAAPCGLLWIDSWPTLYGAGHPSCDRYYLYEN